jgi:hypothetical protein
MSEITDTVEKEIIKETALEFSTRVENLVWSDDISYFEAVQILTLESGYEPERIPKLLTKAMYAKLEYEMENKNLIKRSDTKPLDSV